MKKVIEYRSITGIKYHKDSEYKPGEFVLYKDISRPSVPVKLAPVTESEKNSGKVLDDEPEKTGFDFKPKKKKGKKK